MTLFEFLVPLVGFAFAGAGILFLRHESRQIDRRVRVRSSHPGE